MKHLSFQGLLSNTTTCRCHAHTHTHCIKHYTPAVKYTTVLCHLTLSTLLKHIEAFPSIPSSHLHLNNSDSLLMFNSVFKVKALFTFGQLQALTAFMHRRKNVVQKNYNTTKIFQIIKKHTPTSSTSILSNPRGPRELLTIFATAETAITTKECTEYKQY